MYKNEIAACCKQLKLGQHFAETAIEMGPAAHQEYCLNLLKSEISNREVVRKNKLIQTANFYSRKTFDDFRFDEVTLPNGVTSEQLKSGSYIVNRQNIVMYGNVGTGKTHLSIALGLEACVSGHSVRFFRTAALVNMLSEMKSIGTLSMFMKKLLKAELIIFDEWGYIPIDRTGGELLFEVIAESYERSSVIINTNLEFSKWVNVFYDEQMTSAILDRIFHHCHLILFPGQSNRMRDAKMI